MSQEKLAELADVHRNYVGGRPVASDSDANNQQVTILWNGPPPAWAPEGDDGHQRQDSNNGGHSEDAPATPYKKD